MTWITPLRLWIVRLRLNHRIRALRLAKITALRDAEQAMAEAKACEDEAQILEFDLDALPVGKPG